MYKGKTAAQWLELADNSLRSKQESFERCDTDGFLSQWASGVMADRYRLCAQLAEQNGAHQFSVVLSPEGDMLDAKLVDGKFGLCYRLNDADTQRFGRRFIPTKPGRVWKQLGLTEGTATLPAKVVDTAYGGCIVRA